MHQGWRHTNCHRYHSWSSSKDAEGISPLTHAQIQLERRRGIVPYSTRKAIFSFFLHESCWAEAPIKIARMTLTIKLDGNWSSFQLANSAPPLCVTDSAIAPSARMQSLTGYNHRIFISFSHVVSFAVLLYYDVRYTVLAIPYWKRAALTCLQC